jgi:hypothetical protein
VDMNNCVQNGIRKNDSCDSFTSFLGFTKHKALQALFIVPTPTSSRRITSSSRFVEVLNSHIPEQFVAMTSPPHQQDSPPSGRDHAIETLIDIDSQGALYRAARALVSLLVVAAVHPLRNISSLKWICHELSLLTISDSSLFDHSSS